MLKKSDAGTEGNHKRQRELQLKSRLCIGIIAAFIIFSYILSGREKENSESDSADAKISTAESTETQNSTETEVSADTQETAETDGEASSKETDVSKTDAAETDISDEVNFDELETELETLIAGTEGIWSIYIKDLGSGHTLSMNNQSMYAASLIKLFVMEDSFREMDTLVSNVCQSEGIDENRSREKILTILSNMITVSDNESYNELVRLQSSERSFTKGCLSINESIKNEGYADTGIYHILVPSDTRYEATESTKNHTSAKDCGILLESVYNGTCVSEEASAEMLNLLLQQENLSKIPAGLPSDIRVANKTGETDETQHDAAIVYGAKTDYVLCIMSSEIGSADEAISTIQEISSTVYQYLNEV